MCLSETCSRVRAGRFLSNAFQYIVFKTRRCIITFTVELSLEYVIRRVQENRIGVKLNGNTSSLFMQITSIYCEKIYKPLGKKQKSS